VKVFLDSNVLFSTTFGSEPFLLLWEIARAGKLQLVTSAYCNTEALDNLRHKRPDAVDRYGKLMEIVGEVPDGQDKLEWARRFVPNKDAPVLAAAVAAGAEVLVTGDLKHFAVLMDRSDLPLRIRTIRAFLLEGPQ